jgi:hypothetical protein
MGPSLLMNMKKQRSLKEEELAVEQIEALQFFSLLV